jgi:lincosamide nucleotidyltransferase A/C/D/E
VEAVEVVALLDALERASVEVWVDGGWGVDALLGAQSRPHKDLDIAIEERLLPAFHAVMAARGYREIRPETSLPHNYVLGDADGREVDVHVVVLDDEGNGIFGPRESGEQYPAAALTGAGEIAGRPVRCISPEWMVRFHSGYELQEKDFRDVAALCERFGIALPPEFHRFLPGSRADQAPAAIGHVIRGGSGGSRAPGNPATTGAPG